MSMKYRTLTKTKSPWIKKRWGKAFIQQQVYNKQYNANLSKKEFFKTKNPLTNKLRKYSFTFELNQNGKDYSFFFPQKTITFIAVEGLETENKLKELIQGSISDKFTGGAKVWVESNLIVTPKIRGVEIEKVDYNEIRPMELGNRNYFSIKEEYLTIKKTTKTTQKTLFDKDYNINL